MNKIAKLGLLGLIAGSLYAAGSIIATLPTSAHPLDGEPRLTAQIEKGDISIGLELVASGLTAPTGGTTAPGFSDYLFVADQPGTLWAIDLTDGTKSVFLDVSSRLVSLGFAGPGTFDERGFLGVAFHPNYLSNGLLYTYTSEPESGTPDFGVPEGAQANHHSVIAEWHVPDGASVVDPTSRREVLRIGEPQFNHDGGALHFGPDGMLYISLGDGGGGNDTAAGHTNGLGNGQDNTNVLGSILRIDVDGDNSANTQYGIPGDNPFAAPAGCGDGCDEIYAYGFRNPFRFSIDTDGTLYVGDVGQNDIEEVNIVNNTTDVGGNYGWNFKEGSFCFDPDGEGPGEGNAYDPGGAFCPGDDGSLIDPIAEYDTHIDGHSVIGGFVYHGMDIPALDGLYIFGDFAKVFRFTFNRGKIKLSVTPGRLFYLDEADNILEFIGSSPTGVVLGIGQDADGELYVLGNDTGLPNGTGGTVHRITLGQGSQGGKPDNVGKP